MDSIELKQIGDGWLLVMPSIRDPGRFRGILESLKSEMYILVYEKSYRKYKIPIHELPRISDFCQKYKLELFASPKVIRCFNRYRYKRKYNTELKKSKESFHAIPFTAKYWNKEPEKQPYDYQKLGIELLTSSRRYLLGDDMGLGKTPQAIGVILKSWEYYGFNDAVIVAPNRLLAQWRNEVLKFTTLSPNSVEVLGERKCYTKQTDTYRKNAHVCRGCKFYEQCTFEMDEQKKSQQNYRKLQIKRAKVLIASYTSLSMHTSDYVNRKFQVMIFDEASKVKNHGAKVTKCAKEIVKSLPIDHVVIPMSGTFIENRIGEMHSVVEMVAPHYFGPFPSFKSRYLYMDSQGKIHGIKHEKELKEKIDGIVLRRTIDEVWKDRPEIIETYIECAMDKKQATFYAQTRDGVLQQLKDLEMQDNINQASIGALITYLLMASCTVKAIDPETDIKQHSSKMETLKEILTEEFPDEAKMVIFSRFSNKVTPHLIQEMEKWGVGPILYAKAGNQKLMDSVIEKFKTKEQYRFLVCSDALAYGANFQNANYLVNFDLPWNPAVLDQRIRRIYRRGQHKNVTIMNLIVPGTIEEDLVQTLNEKRALFTKFLKESKTGSNKSNKKSASLSIQEMIKLL